MMKQTNLSYDGETIGKKELFMVVPSMLLAVGILSLPRGLARTTGSSDGWISIGIAGILSMLFAYIVIKLASRFPEQSFFDYTVKIVSKPIAVAITLFLAIYFCFFASYESRMIGTVAKQYIFDRTPVEVISLVFVLLISYAVAGSRAALLRLNLMFFPIVVTVLCFMLLFNFAFFEVGNLRPLFITDLPNILNGVKETLLSFIGFEALLFYTAFLKARDTKGITILPVIGIAVITLIYLLVFIFSIAVFSIEGTQQIIYPTVELAKEVEVPGGIIERIEPLFLTVWVMTIFNTASMALDLLVLSLTYIFPKVKRITVLFCVLPIIYLIGMLPQNVSQLDKFGSFIGYGGLVTCFFFPTILLIIAKLRGVTGDG